MNYYKKGSDVSLSLTEVLEKPIVTLSEVEG
jgi:hypothetical protein